MEIDFTDIEAAINHLVSDLRSLEDQQLLRPVLKISNKVKCILSTLSKAIVQLQVSFFIGSHATLTGRLHGRITFYLHWIWFSIFAFQEEVQINILRLLMYPR